VDSKLEQDSEVEVTLVDGQIVNIPILARARSLDDLLKKVSTENLHSEIETGPAVGKELW
jgi:antitoxin MazE